MLAHRLPARGPVVSVSDAGEPDGEGEPPVEGARERRLAGTRDVFVAVEADVADVGAGVDSNACGVRVEL